MQRNVIVGAGLAGSLLGIYLARRGYAVDLYESRPDPRAHNLAQGRSINLALSKRGIAALQQVDCYQAILPHVVPMYARAIHKEDGQLAYQAFGQDPSEYIGAISRNQLNVELLNILSTYPNVKIHFCHRLVDIKLDDNTLFFHNQADGAKHQVQAQVVFGVDGASSTVRQFLCQQEHAYFEVQEFEHGYKEIAIPAASAHLLAKNYLHSWPRKSFMLLGNPNVDSSFTCTLFLAHKGPKSFSSLTTEQQLQAFFDQHFSDVVPMVPELSAQFFANPIGHMVTVKGGPWFYQDKLMLLGDAAHAIVPFFGQGMNCAFEDCSILNQCLDLHGTDYHAVFKAFYALRKANTDAIADMAMQNYHEIRDGVLDAQFLLHKSIEHQLMTRFPGRYIPMHKLVMFYQVPYAFAKVCGELQRQLLVNLASGITHVEKINWAHGQDMTAQYFSQVAAYAVHFGCQQTLAKTDKVLAGV